MPAATNSRTDWTPSMDEQLLKLKAYGLEHDAIAERLVVSTDAVTQRLFVLRHSTTPLDSPAAQGVAAILAATLPAEHGFVLVTFDQGGKYEIATNVPHKRASLFTDRATDELKRRAAG